MIVLLLGGVSFNSHASEEYSPPVSIQKIIFTYTVKQDGSYQEVSEVSTLIENEEGISSYGEDKISYTPSQESIKILDAYTILPNGTRIKVPLKNIHTAKGNMDGGGAAYSDTQYKVIIYPKVVVGSQLYYKYVRICHTPPFPRQFDFRYTMSPHFKLAQFEVSINSDPRINIKFDAKGVDGGMLPDKGGMHRYRFTYKQDKILPAEDDQIDTDDYAPYVQATTFANYEALGAAYQKRANKKVRVTPDIQKLANELTMGVDDKKEQAHLLYNWVSKNIRYVGSYIGNGGYVPHDSQTIMDNRWGDCKDHVVILEALLAAKGIDSSPALIATGNTYVLPKLAGLHSFNHVITYVPSFDLYLDSTAQFAPFGTLPDSDLNKKVVLTKLNRVGNTPPMLANENVVKTSILLKVLPDGTIQGSSRVKVSGAHEVHFRAKKFSAQSISQDEQARNLLSKLNLTGSGKTHSTDPSDLDKPLEINSTFTLDPISNMPGTGAMRIPPGVVDSVIGSHSLPKQKDKINFPTSCHSFVLNNHYDIEFPPNIKIIHVPENVQFSNADTQYTATYTLMDNKLEISRELVYQNQTMACGEAESERERQFFPVFQRDMRALVMYE